VVTVIPGQIVGAPVPPNDDGAEYKRLRCHFSIDPNPAPKFGANCEKAKTNSVAERARTLVNALLWQRIAPGGNPAPVTNLLDQILNDDLTGRAPSSEEASKQKPALLLHLAVWHVTPNQLTDGKEPRVFSLVHSEWHGFTVDCNRAAVPKDMNCVLKEQYRPDGSPSFYDTGRVYLVAINEFDSQMLGNRVSVDYKLYELPQEPANLVDLSTALSAISGVQLPTPQSSTAVLSPPVPIDTGSQWQGTDNATIMLNIYQAVLPDRRQGPYPVPRSSLAPYSLNADFYLQFQPSPLLASQEQKLGPAPASSNGQGNPSSAQDTSLYLRDHIEQLYPDRTASSLCPLPPGLTFKTDIEAALSNFFPDAKFTPVDEPSHCVSQLTLDSAKLTARVATLSPEGKNHLASLFAAAVLEKEEQGIQYASEQAYISLQLATRVPTATAPPAAAGAVQNDSPHGLTGAQDLPLSKLLLGAQMVGEPSNQLGGAIQAANAVAAAYQSDYSQVASEISQQQQVLSENSTGETKSEGAEQGALANALSGQESAKEKLAQDQTSLSQAEAISRATATTFETLRTSICTGEKADHDECKPVDCDRSVTLPQSLQDDKNQDLLTYQLKLARYAAAFASCARSDASATVHADQIALGQKIKAVTDAIAAPQVRTSGVGGADQFQVSLAAGTKALANAQLAASLATDVLVGAMSGHTETANIELQQQPGSTDNSRVTPSGACLQSLPNASRAQLICTVLEQIDQSEVTVRGAFAKALAAERVAAIADNPPGNGKTPPDNNCCCCKSAPATGSTRSSLTGAGSATGLPTFSTAELRLVAQTAVPPVAPAPALTPGPVDPSPQGGVVTGIPFRAGDFPLLMTIHSDDPNGCSPPQPTGYGPDDNPCIQFVALTSQPAPGASPGGGPGGSGKGGGNNGGPSGNGANNGPAGPGAGNSQAISPNQPVDCGRQSSASSPCSFARTFTVDEAEWWDVSLGLSLPGVKEQILTAAPLTANSLTKTLQTSGNCLSNIYTCTTKHHADAYLLFDLYPLAHWYPKQKWLVPHFNIGVPLTSQVLYRPYAGTAFDLSSPLERRGFPLSISVMSGMVYMKQFVCTAACAAEFASTYVPANTTVIPGVPYSTAYPTSGPLPAPIQDRALKPLFGFEVSISGIASKIKGASSGGGAGANSGKSH
jgi:hypothetical protein